MSVCPSTAEAPTWLALSSALGVTKTCQATDSLQGGVVREPAARRAGHGWLARLALKPPSPFLKPAALLTIVCHICEILGEQRREIQCRARQMRGSLQHGFRMGRSCQIAVVDEAGSKAPLLAEFLASMPAALTAAPTVSGTLERMVSR